MKLKSLLFRSICWLLGDKWEFYASNGQQIDGKYSNWFQCQRCKYYTEIHSRNDDRTPPGPFHVLKRFRAWLRDHAGIRWHSQNLNERAGTTIGSMWRHGRGWLHFRNNSIGLEWSFFRPTSTGASLCLGGEEEATLSFRVNRLFSIYFSLDQLLPRNLKWWDWGWGRKFGVSIHDGIIWFDIFNDPIGWSSQNSWQQFNFDYVDFLLGKMQSTKKELDKGTIAIAFIEGNYTVNYIKELRQWSRPRWPFGDKMIKFDLDMDHNPIPVPGKGENSWDIDDDAIYSMYVGANTLHEAIGKLTQSVYRSRLLYGGIDWQPQKSEMA